MKLTPLFSALTGIALSALAPFAFAHHGNTCVQEAENLTTPRARVSALKNCILEEALEGNVKNADQLQREERCHQNAKNLKLTGDPHDEYISRCYFANDFDKRGPDGKPLAKPKK
jgi:hypothetical protein